MPVQGQAPGSSHWMPQIRPPGSLPAAECYGAVLQGRNYLTGSFVSPAWPCLRVCRMVAAGCVEGRIMDNPAGLRAPLQPSYGPSVTTSRVLAEVQIGVDQNARLAASPRIAADGSPTAVARACKQRVHVPLAGPAVAGQHNESASHRPYLPPCKPTSSCTPPALSSTRMR